VLQRTRKVDAVFWRGRKSANAEALSGGGRPPLLINIHMHSHHIVIHIFLCSLCMQTENMSSISSMIAIESSISKHSDVARDTFQNHFVKEQECYHATRLFFGPFHNFLFPRGSILPFFVSVNHQYCPLTSCLLRTLSLMPLPMLRCNILSLRWVSLHLL